MAQELELDDYTVIHEIGRPGTNCGDSKHSGVEPTNRRLLILGILTLGVLCITQAALNICLRLAFNPNEDTDQFPFNSSVIADACDVDQSQQSPTQLCSCHNNLLRRLLREYQALETERNHLHNRVIHLTRVQPTDNEDYPESGSGFLDLSTNDYS